MTGVCNLSSLRKQSGSTPNAVLKLQGLVYKGVGLLTLWVVKTVSRHCRFDALQFLSLLPHNMPCTLGWL